MKRAIVTINYNEALGANSRASMAAAAARWGCELRVVEGPNHPIHSPASMKTLLFTEVGADLDQIFFLDADTVVRWDTPSPFETFYGAQAIPGLEDALVVVENGNSRFGDLAQIRSAERYEWGKVADCMKGSRAPALACRAWLPYFNTGVMLVNRGHQPIFASAEKLCRLDLGLGWHDQTPLNYFFALLQDPALHAEFLAAQPGARFRSTPVRFVDETWNYIHAECCLGPDWFNMKKYIYHFAGTCGRRQLLASVNWKV